MKNLLFILILFSLTTLNFSQGFKDTQRYNGVKEIAKIPDGMTYKEFLKLQREITWERIAAAAFIPGYLHFYADHNEEGYYILATRLLASGFMIYAAVDQVNYSNSLDFFTVVTEFDSVQTRTGRNLLMFMGGAIVNFIAFAIDWTDADWIIENERNNILYKYGLKVKAKVTPQVSYYNQKPIFGFNLNLTF